MTSARSRGIVRASTAGGCVMSKQKEDESKAPEKESKGAGKNWWALSQYVPEAKLDTVLWSGGGAAVFFLVLWIIWVAVASGRGSRLAQAEKDVEDLNGQISSMSDATLVARLKKEAGDADAARRDAEKKVANLEGKLTRADKDKASLRKEVDALKKDRQDARQKHGSDLKKVNADLKSVRAEYDGLRRAQRDVVKLKRDYDKTKELLATAEKDLTEERQKTRLSGSEQKSVQMELQRKTREHESQLTELKRELEDRDERIKELDLKLQEFPKTPFTEDEAEGRYGRLLEELATITDRDDRIDTYFRAKRALAGTKYERKAGSGWEKEKKLKQRDIDKAALQVYKEAIGQIRSHPQAYDENIAALEKALEGENVQNSRYKKAVEKAINKQKAAAAAAAAKAEAAVKPEEE